MMIEKSKVYKTTYGAALLFFLPGLVQGLAYYFILDSFDVFSSDNDPLTPSAIAGMLFFLVAPLAHFLTTTEKTRLSSIVYSVVLGGVVALLYLSISRILMGSATVDESSAYQEGALVVSFFASFIMCYISLPFFRTVFERGEAPNHYPSLFEFSWNSPVILYVSMAFCGLFTIILILWSALFSLIGIDYFEELFTEPLFYFPVGGAVWATAIGVLREREAIVLAVRKMKFSLLKILSPVLAVATTLFVLALLFQGFDALWNDWSATTLLLLTIALGVLFINAVVGVEEAPEGRLLYWSARVQSVVLVILGGLALYGIWLRIDQYGLTISRVFALVFVCTAFAYALLYGVSAFFPKGYRILRQGNVVLAGGVCLIAILLQTSVLNPWQMSVDDQIKRLRNGTVSAEKLDYGFFQFHAAAPGRKALQDLEKDTSLESHDLILAEIKKVREARSYFAYRRNEKNDLEEFDLLVKSGKLILIPENLPLTDEAKEFFAQEGNVGRYCYLKNNQPCYYLSWTNRFDKDNGHYVLYNIGSYSSSETKDVDFSVNVTLFAHLGEGQDASLHQVSYNSFVIKGENAFLTFREALLANEVVESEVSFKSMNIGGKEIYFTDEHQNESFQELTSIKRVD